MAMKILDKEALKEHLQQVADRDFDAPTEQEVAKKPEADDSETLKKSFMKLLQRREYSEHELRSKAAREGFTQEAIDQALQYLQDNHYQSDERFCDMFIRSRINRLSGPYKLRMELRQKGIDEGLIMQRIQSSEVDWFALALEAASKKCANWPAKDARAKAKLLRFLQGRGFDTEHCRHALDSLGF